MKNKILLTIITTLLLLYLKAQYPCFNGISTNPINPVNNQLPSKRNTFFNWQDPIYNVQPINNDCIRGAQIEAPFFKTDNLEELRESKDMKWDDGWEMIIRGFGLSDKNLYTTDAVPNPYLILYNKYTGILRVLLKICRGADYNAARVKLSFSSLTEIKTDLLELSRGNVSAIDKKFSTVEFAAGAPYYNDNTKWFYADFPMMFDPCTCLYTSKLNIITELITTSNITLEGGITGDIYTKDTGGKSKIQKPGSTDWQNFSGFVNGKLSTVYTSTNNFITQSKEFADNLKKIDPLNKFSALTNFGDALKNNQFLKTGLNAIPWLKSAVGLFDIFFGGGKSSSGPQEVKLLPLAVNLTAKLSGTIATTNSYHNINFTNPGSKDANLDPETYPYYNEVLGVFNLVKSPVLFRNTKRSICDDARKAYAPPIKDVSFRFDADSFLYVLNPAAGLSIQNMQGAIMVKTRPNNKDTADMSGKRINSYFNVFEGKDAMDSTYKFRSEYFDMKCLDRQILRHTSPNEKVFCEIPGDANWFVNYDTVFLKLMINLRRNITTATTQNVLLVLTYPMKVVEDAGQINLPSYNTCDSTILSPADPAIVNSFCASTTYYNLDRQSRAYQDSIHFVEEVEKDGFNFSPNPNNGEFMITIKKQQSNLNSIIISDFLGRKLKILKTGTTSLSDKYQKKIFLNLPNGIYLITVNTSVGDFTKRFIIAK